MPYNHQHRKTDCWSKVLSSDFCFGFLKHNRDEKKNSLFGKKFTVETRCLKVNLYYAILLDITQQVTTKIYPDKNKE